MSLSPKPKLSENRLHRMTFATDDERILAKLGNSSFLSLWSWPNLYRDQGDTTKGGDGKELCDLSVIFGNSILLFSDKRVHFNLAIDKNVSWKRWKKKAVKNSISQLRGAKRWILNNPQRIFSDKKCNNIIPSPIPNGDNAEIFKIAVTHGLEEYLETENGEASFSYSNFLNEPFTIFSENENNVFYHVFTGDSLLFVLSEINTTVDFIEFLRFREYLLATTNNPPFVVTKESDIVHWFFKNNGEVSPQLISEENLKKSKQDALLIEYQGIQALLDDPTYRLKKRNDSISYFWDDLIEHFTRHALQGTSILSNWDSLGEVENVLRRMAEENRFGRRRLAEDFWSFWSSVEPGFRGTRTTFATAQTNIAYVFLLMPEDDFFDSNDQYRSSRQNCLVTYVHIRGLENKDIKEIIGIGARTRSSDSRSDLEPASKNLFLNGLDYVWFDNNDWTEEFEADVVSRKNILIKDGLFSDTKKSVVSRKEFESAT